MISLEKKKKRDKENKSWEQLSEFLLGVLDKDELRIVKAGLLTLASPTPWKQNINER